jgi:putative AdoMet-dependent methyltransferase
MENWYYDEFKQIGINFETEDEVIQYDEKYKTIRNLDYEMEGISKAVGLHPDSIILEIGTGTGEIALRLSEFCKKIYACDVSRTMLDYASKKADNDGIDNIVFIHSGFLSYNIEPETCDAVITQLALHHLPDFWKSVALQRISKSLKKQVNYIF